MNKRETFDEVVKLVREGGDVSQEELVDAWSYAAEAYNETYRLAKGLVAGYKAMQETVKRKNQIIEEKIRQLEERNRIIWTLNQKLRKAVGGAHCAPLQAQAIPAEDDEGEALPDA